MSSLIQSVSTRTAGSAAAAENAPVGSDSAEKVEQPHKSFDTPEEVLADPALSDEQKSYALEQLAQDARQLAIASAEGMGGGEETRLREVLVAKNELEAHEQAFAAVTAFLRDKLSKTEGTEAHPLIDGAIDGLRKAKEAIAALDKMPSPPPGVPKPGSEQEMREEIEKEKLDPGG